MRAVPGWDAVVVSVVCEKSEAAGGRHAHAESPFAYAREVLMIANREGTDVNTRELGKAGDGAWSRI